MLQALERFVTNLPKQYVLILVFIGLYTVTKFASKSARVLLQTFVLPGTSLRKYGSKEGAWAVVTGATDGIGKEFALQLAKAGFNIILVSRSEAKLSESAKEIASQSSVDTRTVAIDFSAPTSTQYELFAKTLEGKKVTVLINNVGRSHELPTSFEETPLAEQNAIISININATLRITHMLLPVLHKSPKGLVLNMSSFAADTPSPLLATYSASKAFIQTWSDALQTELRGTGIDVQCISTYFVVSKMSKIRKPSMLIPTPKQYVRAVLSKINLPCGALGTARPSTSTPYWSHSLLDYFIHVVNWKEAFISYTLNLHKNIRVRALKKKKASEAKQD